MVSYYSVDWHAERTKKKKWKWNISCPYEWNKSSNPIRKDLKEEYGLSIRQIERLTGISRG